MPTHDKAKLLADWHSLLNNHALWVNQSSQYSGLLRLADYMLHVGVIDPLERFELIELLTGAYCHFVEELPQQWLHPASDYSVYNQAGGFVGYFKGNRYFLGPPEKNHGPSSFFAQFSRDTPDLQLRTATGQHYGVIKGRYLHTGTGQKLALVETARYVEGVGRARLDDPDIYRALVDASLLALESGDMPTFVALREKELFSIFTQCPACCDRFDRSEDCVTCAGRGFIEDPDSPNKLPCDFIQTGDADAADV